MTMNGVTATKPSTSASTSTSNSLYSPFDKGGAPLGAGDFGDIVNFKKPAQKNVPVFC